MFLKGMSKILDENKGIKIVMEFSSKKFYICNVFTSRTLNFIKSYLK